MVCWQSTTSFAQLWWLWWSFWRFLASVYWRPSCGDNKGMFTTAAIKLLEYLKEGNVEQALEYAQREHLVGDNLHFSMLEVIYYQWLFFINYWHRQLMVQVIGFLLERLCRKSLVLHGWNLFHSQQRGTCSSTWRGFMRISTSNLTCSVHQFVVYTLSRPTTIIYHDDGARPGLESKGFIDFPLSNFIKAVNRLWICSHHWVLLSHSQ